jgi:hypothetical protein
MNAMLEPTADALPAPATGPDLPAVRTDPARVFVFDMDANGKGVAAKIVYGEVDGRDSGYQAAVYAESLPAAEALKVAFATDLAALPSTAEVGRLETVVAGYREKLAALADDLPALRGRIVAAAKAGSLATADRKLLDNTADEQRAYQDVLTLAEADLSAARSQFAADRFALARKHLAAADSRWEDRLAEIREAVVSDDRFWNHLHDLVTAAAVNRQATAYFRSIK